MPAATRYIEDQNSADAKALERSFVKEWSQRKADIAGGWKYYDGDMLKPLRPDKTRVDDNVIINLVALLVDKGVSNLVGTDEAGEIEGVEFEVVHSDQPTPNLGQRMMAGVKQMVGMQEPEDPAQAWLDQVMKANKKNILLHDTAQTGGIGGHVFMKIIPAEPYPRLLNLDPCNVTCFWDEDDITRILWYRIQYEGASGSKKRQDIVRAYKAVNESDISAGYTESGDWVIYDYRQEKRSSSWVREGVTPWPYPFPPLIEWKNLPNPRGYYGKDDIAKGGQLNDSLNFVLGNVQRILKNHANPKSIGTGFQADKLTEAGVGSLWVIDNPDAKIFNLEMASDLASSLNFAQLLRRSFFDSGRELDPATVQDRLGDLTNFALRVLYRDTLQKGTTKRLHYGDGLQRVCKALLVIGGHASSMDAVDVNVVWPDPLPSDPVAQSQALTADVQVGGLSRDTYLSKRGYDPDAEAQKRERQRQESVTDQTAVNDGQQAGLLGIMGKMFGRQQTPAMGGQVPGQNPGGMGTAPGGPGA